jgi:tRNA(fMet)-specific endonuclease VapC
MTLIDTDILSLLLAGNARALSRLRLVDDEIAISVITKIEILRGSYDFVLNASDGIQLERRNSGWTGSSKISPGGR